MNLQRPRQRGHLSLFLVAALCGRAITVSPAALTAIAVQPSTLAVPLTDGPAWTLRAIGTFADATVQDLTRIAQSQSMDPSVVQVDAGTVLTEGEGETTVQATYGTVSGSGQVTVGPAEIRSSRR